MYVSTIYKYNEKVDYLLVNLNYSNMTKINFSAFSVYTDITKSTKRILDLKQAIADKLYTEIPGIAAHELALRIYRSDGEMELNDNDVVILRDFTQQCTGALADSFEDAINGEM